MGLDMYLEAKKYVGGGDEFMRTNRDGTPKEPNDEVKQFDAILAAFGLDYAKWKERYPEGDSLDVSFRVAYWRMANAVHAWFVKNVQGGKDDCQRYYVDRNKLVELRDICTEILGTVEKGEPVKQRDKRSGKDYDRFPNMTFDKDKAAKLLPSRSGFLFGSTDYNEWYVQDLEKTVAQITAILDDPFLKDASFYYRASW